MSNQTYRSTGQPSNTDHAANTRIKVEKVLKRDQKLSELNDRAHAFQQGASQLKAHATMLKRKYMAESKECESLELLSNTSSLPTKMERTRGRRTRFFPRLVDYIATVRTRSAAAATSSEINSTSSFASSSIQVPELLRRYPPNDHKDFPLPPDIVFFCQPEGCSFVKTKRSAVREVNTFVFTLTEKDANRVRYGIVVNFYRPVELKRTPCSVENISARPTPSPTTNPNEDSKRPPSVRPPSSASSSSCHHTPSCRRRHANLSSLTSLCLISHHPFFPSFRECLFILKQLIDAGSDKNFHRKSPTSSTSSRHHHHHHHYHSRK